MRGQGLGLHPWLVSPGSDCECVPRQAEDGLGECLSACCVTRLTLLLYSVV